MNIDQQMVYILGFSCLLFVNVLAYKYSQPVNAIQVKYLRWTSLSLITLTGILRFPSVEFGVLVIVLCVLFVVALSRHSDKNTF
jgi:hypothetical protein